MDNSPPISFKVYMSLPLPLRLPFPLLWPLPVRTISKSWYPQLMLSRVSLVRYLPRVRGINEHVSEEEENEDVYTRRFGTSLLRRAPEI